MVVKSVYRPISYHTTHSRTHTQRLVDGVLRCADGAPARYGSVATPFSPTPYQPSDVGARRYFFLSHTTCSTEAPVFLETLQGGNILEDAAKQALMEGVGDLKSIPAVQDYNSESRDAITGTTMHQTLKPFLFLSRSPH